MYGESFFHSVQDKCSASEFQNWLAPIQVIEGEGLILEVPNIFVQEYLLGNYKKDLAAFVPTTSSGELALQFVISEEKKGSVPLITTPPKEVENQDTSHLKLNPYYLFENFIEGPSNQFVKSAAMGVAARPGRSYNPLFIHGGVGLGKTHLLHAIAHHIKQHNKKLKIQCITTEGFINDIIDHLKTKSMDRMKRFYRSLDVLLVDDIQFLQSRLNFEEELCNTFESLIKTTNKLSLQVIKPLHN
jgi:chromosomal replication initiator protein